MADQQHLDLLKQGVSAWNLWRRENPEANPDLSETDLHGLDLSEVNLSETDLHKTNLSEANLYKANLHGANLGKAVLHRATLIQTILNKADLNWADLAEANLSEAKLDRTGLEEAILYDAILREALLSGALLSGADLRGADLVNATLIGTNLHGANLRGANLRGANLDGADLREAYLSEREIVQLRDSGVIGLDQAKALNTEIDSSSILHIRIVEEPLTSYNLAIAFTALTELTTKFWLIGMNRLSDLIEYTQTHHAKLAKEAGSTIMYATYNSPFNFGFQVDELVPGIADATITVIDGLTQRKAKLEKLELENQEKAQKAKNDEHKSELERMKEELAIERERVVLLRETIETQKQGIEYALEIAGRLVDTLYPNTETETKGMLIRTLLPNILQLQNVKGLELTLPAPASN